MSWSPILVLTQKVTMGNVLVQSDAQGSHFVICTAFALICVQVEKECVGYIVSFLLDMVS